MCWPCCHPLIWRYTVDGVLLWTDDWDLGLSGVGVRSIEGVATDGERIFAVGTRATPVAGDASQAYAVRCLSADGETLWQHDPGATALSCIFWPDNGLLVGHDAARENPLAGTGQIVNYTLLDPEDGTVIWKKRIGQHGNGTDPESPTAMILMGDKVVAAQHVRPTSLHGTVTSNIAEITSGGAASYHKIAAGTRVGGVVDRIERRGLSANGSEYYTYWVSYSPPIIGISPGSLASLAVKVSDSHVLLAGDGNNVGIKMWPVAFESPFAWTAQGGINAVFLPSLLTPGGPMRGPGSRGNIIGTFNDFLVLGGGVYVGAGVFGSPATGLKNIQSFLGGPPYTVEWGGEGATGRSLCQFEAGVVLGGME